MYQNNHWESTDTSLFPNGDRFYCHFDRRNTAPFTLYQRVANSQVPISPTFTNHFYHLPFTYLNLSILGKPLFLQAQTHFQNDLSQSSFDSVSDYFKVFLSFLVFGSVLGLWFSISTIPSTLVHPSLPMSRNERSERRVLTNFAEEVASLKVANASLEEEVASLKQQIVFLTDELIGEQHS